MANNVKRLIAGQENLTTKVIVAVNRLHIVQIFCRKYCLSVICRKGSVQIREILVFNDALGESSRGSKITGNYRNYKQRCAE